MTRRVTRTGHTAAAHDAGAKKGFLTVTPATLGTRGGISSHCREKLAALLPKVVATAPAAFVSVYVEADDLQATPDELEKLGGGRILPPSEVPGGPKLAIFTDPVGNVTGLLLRVKGAVGLRYS